MILHKQVKQFDKRTGKEIESEWVPTRTYICDYSGAECDADENYEVQPMYTFKADYYDGLEQAWYYDYDNIEYFRKLNVEYGSIFDVEYMFMPDVNGSQYDASFWLNQEWMDGVDVKGHTFYECATLEEAMRRARVRTIRRLLDEKAYTPQQLGLLQEPY
jgi:hypothetical protein